MGQDGTLDAEQREVLWTELRPVKMGSCERCNCFLSHSSITSILFQIYKPVRLLKPEQVLELGCIVTEMGERELQAIDLSNLAVVAHLGSLNGWNTKKV